MAAAHSSPPPPHNIALLPPLALLGHLIPFIELAKKLVLHHNCTITLIIPHHGSPTATQTSLLKGLPAKINPVFLPPADNQPENSSAEISVPARLIRSLPALRHTLSSLRDSGTPAAALVVDLFAPHAIHVARELDIPAYIFYIVGATELSLCLDLAKLDESWSISGKRDDLIKLPGSIEISPEDFSDSMRDRDGEIYKSILHLCSKYATADGILVNSFLGLESEAFHELERRRPDIPPVYPVGPMIRAESDDDHHCLKWLNDQPHKSVLFVSFGSVGSLSMEQLIELALGLEMSGQRFLWVVRRPQENVAAAYVSNNVGSIISKDSNLEFLPQGFLERTRDRGLVVESWAPQVRVLSHGSTGGFLTHCGWSSILEAVVCGVPMIAWPLCFDHKMNAVFLTDGLEGAIRVSKNENGIVERDCASLVVKQLMEGEQGEKIRERMMDVKAAAADVMGQEGSSAQALAQVVKRWIHG